jgi:hypothetical protein
VHETQDRIDVSFVDTAAPELLVLDVVYAVHTAAERPLALEFNLQERRQLAVLETPEILAILALARRESPPELGPDEGAEAVDLTSGRRFDIEIRVEGRPERD